MAMEPIWECDFHPLSYGFRPERSVHHAIRTVKLQLTDCGEIRGRWVIEGDLSSYFDTVHHPLSGNRKGTYSITVRANWRLTFEFEDGDAYILDLEDYHR